MSICTNTRTSHVKVFREGNQKLESRITTYSYNTDRELSLRISRSAVYGFTGNTRSRLLIYQGASFFFPSVILLCII